MSFRVRFPKSQFSEKGWNNIGLSLLIYWVQMPQCWQQGPQKPLLGVVRAAPCWTQLIPVAANIPSQGISEPHSQGGGTAGKVYLGNRILKTFFFLNTAWQFQKDKWGMCLFHIRAISHSTADSKVREKGGKEMPLQPLDRTTSEQVHCSLCTTRNGTSMRRK